MNKIVFITITIFAFSIATTNSQAKSDKANSAVKNNPSSQKSNNSIKNSKLEIKSAGSSNKKVNLNLDNGKVKVEQKSGKATIKAQTQYGTSEEIETETDGDEAVVEVEVGDTDDNDSTDTSTSPKTKFKIKSKNRQTVLEQSKFAAKTHYPLSVNSETNELTITTPAGSKVVTILPDQAINNMLRRGVIDNVATSSGTPLPSPLPTSVPGSDDDSTDSATPVDTQEEPTDDNPIILTSIPDTGEVVYKVKGSKSKRLFGIIPVTVDKTATLDAQTGALLAETYPNIWERFLNRFSTE